MGVAGEHGHVVLDLVGSVPDGSDVCLLTIDIEATDPVEWMRFHRTAQRWQRASANVRLDDARADDVVVLTVDRDDGCLTFAHVDHGEHRERAPGNAS